MNLVGAISFSPPVPYFRQAFHLPAGEPLYLWVLSLWILGFGAAYFYQGWTGQPNRAVLAIGVWGKLTFVLQLFLLGQSQKGLPMAWLAAIPDLLCALAFAWWLWHPTNK